jgi:hypothetical protein
MNKNKKLGYK